jgi:undecaprenyl diphosphate synthase
MQKILRNLLKKLKMNHDLKHIAIIMDGNRRWAKNNNLSVADGHKQGAKTTLNIIKSAVKRKISCLTLYAFSTENWMRPEEQVDDLIQIMLEYITNEISILTDFNIKFSVIGDISKFSNDLQSSLLDAMEISKDFTGLHLIIALNYGGRDEIIRAIKSLYNTPNVDIPNLNEKYFASFLDTANISDPDLLIRSGGEKRISNFLLWQNAYSELYFSDIMWPEFSDEELEKAINEFELRVRKYGKE